MIEYSPLRIKSAMIVYELEKALGRFCNERSASLNEAKAAKEIALRISGSGQDSSIATLIEHSYLAEVISLAMHAAKGTHYSEWVANLERLCSSLSIFDIRNAISHPNRPFPEHYWFRCMAIAADPSINALGLIEVELALQNAMAGKIEEPPADWIQRAKWSIPAIIPEHFEHSITGLVGRAQEAAKLEKELTNPRTHLISVVARGGVGKTSLALQVISDFCLSEKAISNFDSAIWLTLKQERLTESGIEFLSAPKSMDELKSAVQDALSEVSGYDFKDFQEAKEDQKNKRILLCIDNLETILRDDPEQFDVFYEELPVKWKVLITSRIPVDGAKNIPLDALSEPGAVALARAYFASKGSAQCDNQLLSRIVSGCKRNPLAIRLTIDLYLSGREINEALQKSDQEVLEFSFTNLVDTLKEIERDTLEAIFAIESPTRSQLCEALNVDVDNVAQSLAKLSSMSLVSRQEQDDQEIYNLGSSIRDLLRGNPCNLSVRSKVANWLQLARSSEEQALRLQLERKVPKLSLEYIPEGASFNEIQISKQIAKSSRKNNRPLLIENDGKLRHLLTQNANSAFLCRLYAWCLLELDDAPSAFSYFQRAQALDADDPAPIYGAVLALHAQRRWKEILPLAKRLIELGYGDWRVSGAYIANRVWSLYLLSENINENMASVFDATREWEVNIDHYPSWAVSRASAYRRLADLEYRRGQCHDQRLGSLLSKMTKPMYSALVQHDCARWMMPELEKIVREFEYYASRSIEFKSFRADDAATIVKFVEFCEARNTHLALAGISKSSIEQIRKFCGVGPDAGGGYPKDRDAIEQDGIVVAWIKRGGKPGASYVFAQDKKHVDYYVHMDVFESGSWSNRHLLAPGAKIFLRYEKSNSGSALRATDAWLAS